jgi:nucleotide-binding universal stress UspA family protein
MKTILIATDFSAVSLNAARYMAGLSDDTDVERIILYHSYRDEPQEMIILTDVLAPVDGERAALEQQAIQGLSDLQATLALDIRKEIKIEIQTDERLLTDAINEISAGQNVDLVVIGMKKIIGTHIFQVMKECERNLLIIPITAAYTGLGRVMLACDLDKIAERLPVSQLKELIKSASAKLFVVNVEHNGAKDAADIIREENDLHKLLDDVEPQYYYPVSKNKPEALIRFAEGHQIDLVITVHRKRGLLEELFHDSLTKRLAIQTDIPLLILHKQ